MRQYAGFGTAKESERALPHLVAQGTGGLSVASTCPRRWGYDSDDPVARARWQGRRRDRLARGHADPVRPDPAGPGLHLDDHQRAGVGPAAALRAGRRGEGHLRRQAHRHDPERRAQGVHRPRDLHLPAGALAAADHQHLRVLQDRAAALEHDLDLRLPHGRGRGDARRRRSPSRSRTASSTSAPPSRPGSAVDDFAPRLAFFFVSRTTLLEEVAKFRAARGSGRGS
jgi:methylmalonyl-CoA mutase N-terminal domain/subunit